MRDDFSQGVKDLLARRVSYRCSNPDCKALTVGPATEAGKSVNLGVASHITAASSGGPRFDSSLSPALRQSADNGIWLCQICSVHIDKDVLKYPVDLLRKWKRQAEEEAASALGKAAATHNDLTSVASALSGQLAPSLAQQVSAMVLDALQTPAKPSSDAVDAELDEAKQELEQHQPNMARRLTQRVLTRHGNSVSGWQRWRAETLIANTYIAEGDLFRAGQMLVDARRHDPTGEKARINEVVGYELLGQTAKAHDLAAELRGEMPASPPVIALWVRTAPASMPSSDVEEGAQLLAGTNADVALALASLLLFRREAERAEPHALSVTQLQPDAPQAWLLLGQAVHLRGHSAVCLAQRSELLRRAEIHYAQAIALAHVQECRHIEAGARLNRAIVRDLLGDTDHAGDDFREAIRLAPHDSDIVRRYAVFLSVHGRQDDAINEARRAVQIAPTAANEVILAGLLYERSLDGDCEEALGLCRSMLGRHEMERLAEQYEIATACLYRLGRFAEARTMLEAGRDNPLAEVCRLVLLGRTYFEEKDRPTAAQHALDAMNLLTEATSTDDRRRLADLLMRLGKYSDAISLVEQIVRPGALDETTQMLLDAAHRAKHHGVILRVCRQLREAGVDDRRVWHLETEVLSLYDRPAAIDTLQRYLHQHPDDRFARLRRSLLYLQNEQPELIETDLGQLPSPDEAHPGTVGRAVIGLLQRVGRSVDALRFAYTLLRRHFDDPDANLFYLMLFFQCDHDGWPVNDLECVGPGAAVCYREVGVDEERWLVIEDDTPEAARDEFPSGHVRVTPMLGRSVGEQFLLAPGVQPRMGEVLRICSKFVYRFERCRDEYQTRFPNRQDFQIVRLVRPGSGNERELDLRPILETLEERRQFILEVANAYATHPMPLHTLCRMTGRDLFEVMDFLTSHPDVRIRAWMVGGVEGMAAVQHLIKPQAVVLELTALFAVWRLDLIGLLESWQPLRLVVSQSTFDRLRDNAEAFAMSANHCRMFADGTGRYVWQETSEDVQEQLRDSLQRLVGFVRDHCEISCCRELADFDPERREELLDVFGRDELESMCLAGREGHVLWTDDAMVAGVAQEMFRAERRVWTQVLLRSAAERDLLGQIQFQENSARLIGYGYGTTWFTPETLYWAAKMANWSYRRWPFHQVLRYFRSEEVSVRDRQQMAAAFLALVFRLECSSLTRWAALGATLTSFANHRLVQSLEPYIDAVFGVDTPDWREVRQLVNRWLGGALRYLR